MEYKLEELILKLKTTKEAKKFLKGILTPTEYEDVKTRLKIISMLKKGVSQHEIAEKLGVGVATVTRGSKALQNGDFDILETLGN